MDSMVFKEKGMGKEGYKGLIGTCWIENIGHSHFSSGF